MPRKRNCVSCVTDRRFRIGPEALRCCHVQSSGRVVDLGQVPRSVAERRGARVHARRARQLVDGEPDALGSTAASQARRAAFGDARPLGTAVGSARLSSSRLADLTGGNHDDCERRRRTHPGRPGHADGRADAGVLDAGAEIVGAGARRSAGAADVAGREADRLPRQRPAGSASWITAVRTAAPRCSSAATRRAASAASITAGSSTSSGQCIDMPSVPPQQDFKHKVKAKAYRTLERAGLVWVYMGARAEAPPLPALQILDAPDAEINVGMIQRDCNYLQAIEGEIDTAHFGYLHGGHADPARLDESEPFYFTVTNRAPEFHVADAPWGTQYAGYRSAGAGRHLLALRQLPVSVLDAGAERRVRQPRARPRLGADRRPSHDVRLHLVEARPGREQPAAAGLQGRHAGRRHRPRQQAAAQHDRLARPLAHGRQRSQRLGHGSRGAAHQPDLQRHRRHPPAGPGDHREHGTGRRPHVRASRPVRPDDHPHPAAAADGGARAARPGHPAARRRGRRRLSRRPQRLFRQRRPARLARGLRHAARRGAASRVRRRARAAE